MSGERYRGQLDHIGRVISEAGFQGFEPEPYMLGDFSNARRLADILAEYDLKLASVAYAAEWRHEVETSEERAEADQIITLVGSFPPAKLVLVQLPGNDRAELQVRQKSAIACMNAVGHRALDAGLRPTVHPNSPPGSIFRVSTDYETLLASLDPEIGFTPDVGHVAAGGMDPLATIKRYRERVDHIHFKDIHDDESWAATGEGRIQFREITTFLAGTGYDGWIVMEDESEGAKLDPDTATRRNGVFASQALVPAIRLGSTHRGEDL
jgi:inosose dehydratase